jgi:acetyl-CoA carboxylase biotin carboxyl carrier protein
MDIQNILTLIEAVSNADIMNFQIEEGNFHLKMDKLKNAVEVLPGVQNSQIEQVIKDTIEPVKNDDNTSIGVQIENLKEIKSPIVGTFYTASGPDQPDFVKVGDTIKKGQVVCIVEAMKLMNDIESDFDGEIVEILVKNEQMVEYGQVLFKIKG